MNNPRKAIRAIIFDIDGTLAVMDKATHTYTALPGAVETIAACRAAGLKTAAYTNGTFFPPADYYPLLTAAGLAFDNGHVLTPASVAAKYLTDNGHTRIMVLGAEGTRVPLCEAGLDVLTPTRNTPKVDAVLVGWTRDFGLPELEAACEAVWNGAELFTVSDAPYFASGNGRMLGVSGAIAAMISQVTDARPIVLGKPSTLGLHLICNFLDVHPEETLVIGDDPSLEIRMAREAGAHAVGVTTGISDRQAFDRVPEPARAHHVLTGLQDFNPNNWL
ncbi:HAD-IIA family hydrolase [Ochrobactrum teleogrylli]|uniref:Haloacid dehalogenase n=1 Tax=Ochrobactrum teleogrylli TaxID=2479765 RepID=A0ABY2XZS1_9HYPH|nr:HAD family hydrolase [[Ochrobactrum] teleogrylli]TNV10073.1 haloacid dehalogenase [[Ochrobactrum] teleogrylli]